MGLARQVAFAIMVSLVTVGAACGAMPSEWPCDPYDVGLSSPKLTTPQWVGERDVDAVVILSIDDMRDVSKYEAFLRPVLERLKQIDGRAPVSIFTNSIDPHDQQLQSWLEEGLSLEVHTVDHPCPLLRDGDFEKAKSTYDRCVDMMVAVPNSHPVAYRMPCCDSLNTPSPRFWTEVFDKKTAQANYLSIDSSVFNVFTAADADLPARITTNENGKPRFRSYLPFDSFVNTIENYPYPYIVGASCWEFPCVVPSDWEAQNVQRPNNPDTVRDLNRALDATVLKQGVMPIVFHPHGWIRNDQLVDFIDYADQTYGRRVRFLTFAEALQRINHNLLGGVALRTDEGNESSVRLADVNGDGFIDVMRRNGDALQTRVWHVHTKRFRIDEQTASFREPRFFRRDHRLCYSDVDPHKGLLSYSRRDGRWEESKLIFDVNGLASEWQRALMNPGQLQDHRWRDIDGCGTDELLVTLDDATLVFAWKGNQLKRLPFSFPAGGVVCAGRDDAGVRLEDLNGDGCQDVLHSDGVRHGVWLFEDMQTGWKEVRSGDASDPDAIPMVARPDGSNNGAWFHSEHLWVQNEYTARQPDLVERATFAELTSSQNEEASHPLGEAKSLEESLKTFELVSNAKLHVVASEPQIQDPVAFDWGPDGTLWVVEMGDYPNGADWHGPGDEKGAAGGRVKCLQDRDGNGHFETAHLFLDGLASPTGVKAWRSGVLISAAPDIIYAEDTDGDFKADVRRVLYTGLKEGNQQHRANGLRWGLDHWLHLANGDSGGKVVSTKTGVEVNIRGRDFRIQPDQGSIELTSGQTQFGRSRDSSGNWFGGNNSHPVWHYVLEEKYMQRNPHFSPPSSRHEIARIPGPAPVYPASQTVERFNDFDRANRFTSACSPEIFRDEAPRFRASEMHNFVYVCEPVHNLVHRSVIRRAGSTFTSDRAASERETEFLRSSDNWFRPVMVRTGPDSAIWVADMYRMVIEHPEWIPTHWQDRIDHLAGNDRGRIYRVELLDQPLTNDWRNVRTAPLPRLVGMLDTSNGIVRDMVQQELYERDDRQAIPLLRRLVKDLRWPQAAVPVVYLLHHFGELDVSYFAHAIGDPGLLRHHLRVAESALATSDELRSILFDKLVQEISSSSNLRNKIQLAYTLGDLNDERVGSALAKIVMSDVVDQHLRAAVMSSISRRNVDQFTATLLQSEQPVGPRSVDAFSQLLDDLVGSSVGFGHRGSFRRLVRFAAEIKGSNQRKLRLTGACLQALRLHESATSDLVDTETANALTRLVVFCQKVATDETASEPVRLVALDSFGYDKQQRQTEHATLLGLLAPQTSRELQAKALRTLARTGNDAVAGRVFSGWSSFTPGLRDVALSVAVERRAWVNKLLDRIEDGQISSQQVSVRYRQRLLNHSVDSVQRRAVQLFAPVERHRESIVRRYSDAATSDLDVTAGKAVFKKQCSVCHLLEGEGKSIGPDLAAVSDKSAPAMLVAILDPNRAVEEKYLAYTVVTHAGETKQGLLFEETATAITLAAPDGEIYSILRSQIDTLDATGKSLMPEGLEQTLSPQDVANVVAYVQTVSAPRKMFVGNEPQLAPVRDDGSIRLFAIHAEIYGPTVVLEPKYRNLGFWQSREDRATWTIDAPRAGRYELHIDYACAPQATTNRFQIRLNEQRIGSEVQPTGSWDSYRTRKVDIVELPDEPVRLTFEADGPIDGYLIDLRTILLYPE